MDHLKVRVASAGASAMFYSGLFGSDIIAVRNATLPESPEVLEFFLKIGAPSTPYLMLSQARDGESPGLDHVSVLANDISAARATLSHHGISPIDPNRGLWFRDADGTLIELMADPTWGNQAQSMRLPLPTNLPSFKPAFQPASLSGIQLRTPDVDRSAAFYRRVFGPAFDTGKIPLRFRPASTPGLDRLVVAVHNLKRAQARRILQQRGIQPYGSPREVLLRDPDGNEVQLV
jgi:catechol 2,3-dioxygenase-like lactoylglutathione lyase family enzyme